MGNLYVWATNRKMLRSFLIVFSLLLLSVAKPLPDFNQIWKNTQNEDGYQFGTTFGGVQILESSDLRPHSRKIWIITTACLPWMTGTSINPLLRAAYLANERPDGHITLMVPYLEKEEQDIAFPPNIRFDCPSEQEKYVRDWLIRDAHMPEAARKLRIVFYSARYHDEFHSIFPMGDIADLVPDEDADVCILEEPEHLTWYRAPFTTKSWDEKFRHVIGIIHTNYLSYSRTQSAAVLKEPFLYFINQGMCRAYVHKIIKLSGALQEFASEKEEISNVHGVRTKYLEIGDACATKKFTKGAYFVGKLAWPKGLDEMFRLMGLIRRKTGQVFALDIYGQGPHSDEMKAIVARDKLPAVFFGARDHAQLTDYRVFVNPSTSEVLCTTVVEALAMGKWVVVPKHPSNAFFEQFPNCLIYRTDDEFAANVYWALSHDPRPLSRELRHTLTWEAATDRLIAASMISAAMHSRSKQMAATNRIIGWVHEAVSKGSHGDLLRQIAGGRGAANQMEFIKKHGSARAKFNATVDVVGEVYDMGIDVADKSDEGSIAKESEEGQAIEKRELAVAAAV